MDEQAEKEVGDMAQLEKVLTSKADDLSSYPETCMTKIKNQLLEVILCPPHMYHIMYTPPTHKKVK